MRATTLLRRLVDVTATRVTGVRFFTGGTLSVEVAPLWRKPRCGVFGHRAPMYDRRPLHWSRHQIVGAGRAVGLCAEAVAVPVAAPTLRACSTHSPCSLRRCSRLHPTLPDRRTRRGVEQQATHHQLPSLRLPFRRSPDRDALPQLGRNRALAPAPPIHTMLRRGEYFPDTLPFALAGVPQSTGQEQVGRYTWTHYEDYGMAGFDHYVVRSGATLVDFVISALARNQDESTFITMLSTFSFGASSDPVQPRVAP
jgi:hypothetical protein